MQASSFHVQGQKIESTYSDGWQPDEVGQKLIGRKTEQVVGTFYLPGTKLSFFSNYNRLIEEKFKGISILKTLGLKRPS